MSRVPQYYVEEEGGYYLKWPFPDGPDIHKRDLEQRDRRHVFIQGIKVHALIFGDPAKRQDMYSGDPEFPEWDCINGWRDERYTI